MVLPSDTTGTVRHWFSSRSTALRTLSVSSATRITALSSSLGGMRLTSTRIEISSSRLSEISLTRCEISGFAGCEMPDFVRREMFVCDER